MHEINKKTLMTLVNGGTVHSVTLIGIPGGWSAIVKYGMTESVLSLARGKVRVFRTTDTAISFFREFGIVHFAIDATKYSPDAPSLPGL